MRKGCQEGKPCHLGCGVSLRFCSAADGGDRVNFSRGRTGKHMGLLALLGCLVLVKNMTEWVDLVKDEIECLETHDSPSVTNPTILKDSQPSGATVGGGEGGRRPRGLYSFGLLCPWESFTRLGRCWRRTPSTRGRIFPQED